MTTRNHGEATDIIIMVAITSVTVNRNSCSDDGILSSILSMSCNETLIIKLIITTVNCLYYSDL